MKRVLVTGASGFIGRRLVARLEEEGCLVRALVHSRTPDRSGPVLLETVTGDVRDAGVMKRATQGVDTVFHLAGKVHEVLEVRNHGEDYFAVNVEGTRNLLEGAMAAGVERFIFFSSVKAMGEETPRCFDETEEAQPVTAYGKSKREAEEIVLNYGKKSPMHVACLRLPLVYGIENKGNVSRMIAWIHRGFFPPLPALDNRRSMVSVEDVVSAALLVARNPRAKGQCYIVTDGKNYSTTELYREILCVLGKPTPRWRVPLGLLKFLARAGDVVERLLRRRFIFDSDSLGKLTGSAWYSCDKIVREVHYRPSVTFRDALPEMIRGYRRKAA
ncbi:MAG: NAD-dependent epimerase/dehydratase family protein [Deltaproteobacteria bacterium]|nr:NAD-dependent epimerase/dehydratase family protein [Deltaproteobacteria bacterium]